MNFYTSIYSFFSFFFFFISGFIFLVRLVLIYRNKIYIIEWSLLNINGCDIIFPILLDKYGVIFRSVVMFISANIFKFCNYYIEGECFHKRFLYLVILFVLSINFLIYIPHIIALLLGWDGLGLVSFLLVIYYQNRKSLGAGIITALSNRIGDVFLLLRISWSLSQGHYIIFFMWDRAFSSFVVFRIIIAAMTKRAQIPFSSWLPAAIAAPTPVRSLVHSSTLVTAGVFLIIRFYNFLRSIDNFNSIILVISSLTIFIAGIRALAECDIKKIVALSTLSQLGVIMSSIGLGLPDLAFFHLITHALFKALLFVCVGTLIHVHHHRQDLRNMGNLVAQMPLTICCLNIANIALCGLPFLAGFYSKDFIIEIVLYRNYRIFIVVLFLTATIITAAYSIRLIIVGITSINISFNIQYMRDNRLHNTWPILILSLGAIMSGCLINWFFFRPLIEPSLSYSNKLLAFIVTVLGGLFMYYLVLSKFNFSLKYKFIHNLRCYMWFIAPLSTQIILKLPLRMGKYNLSLIDQGWVEVVGGQGIFVYLKKVFINYQIIQISIIISHLSLICFFFLFISLL